MHSPGSASQLSPQRREVLTALVSGNTVSEAAAQSGVHCSTIHDWTRTATVFRAALMDAHAQQASMVLDGLRAKAAKALEAIEIFAVERTSAAGPYANLENEPRLGAADVDKIVEAATRVEEKKCESNPAPQPPEASAPGFMNQARAA